MLKAPGLPSRGSFSTGAAAPPPPPRAGTEIAGDLAQATRRGRIADSRQPPEVGLDGPSEPHAMSDILTPQNTVTFTITKLPRREAQRKTIQRLMQIQPEVQKGLKALQKQRQQKDNRTYVRAGRPWTDRARATRLTRVEKGATFTLRLTPQIIPDLRSVEQYLEAEAAS
jgi:hypothetical protein